MKYNFKNIIINALMIAIPIIIVDYQNISVARITVILAIGMILGLAFIYLYNHFFIRRTQQIADKLFETIQLEINPGEKIILESGANLVKGIEAVGGKLALTDKRLIFKSHQFNIQKLKEEIAIDQINDVAIDESTRSGMVIKLNNNETHKFNVEAPVRAEWIEKISALQ